MNEWRMNETHLQTQWILDRDDDPASKQIETKYLEKKLTRQLVDKRKRFCIYFSYMGDSGWGGGESG
ncbi:hypothetical protein DERF_000503 [Dermatophagoides farinae]|uniref:Uncharacterized protein n=1 Tax=Dermatophagoides farinae TaxID=6954 RepID=A0A922LCH7_DERFA|nr:hypothetical protein DERF_000503 [Dermatophagoides farinae]